MRQRPTPTTPDATPTPVAADQAAPASSYDWSRFGRHRFRTPAAVVVDSPFAPVGAGWIATMWPDTSVAGGWGRML